jgi:sortase B
MQEFATAGSIFLDYMNTIGDDFLIIYGHRMSYGGMFTDLIKFKDRLFFDEHEIGELFVDEAKWRLEIVAFGLISASNHEIYDLRGNELREMMMRAMYVREATDGRYILLSTCDSENKAMRDVLLLRIVEQL